MACMLTFVRVVYAMHKRVDVGYTFSHQPPCRRCYGASFWRGNHSPVTLYHQGTLSATESSGGNAHPVPCNTCRTPLKGGRPRKCSR
jgi:hypothetical protein